MYSIHQSKHNPNWKKNLEIFGFLSSVVCGTFCCINSLWCYGDLDMVQQWLRSWIVAWHNQAITWTNVDLSSNRFCGSHLRPISQRVSKIWICKMSWSTCNITTPLMGQKQLPLPYPEHIPSQELCTKFSLYFILLWWYSNCFIYPSKLLHWHCGNHMICPVPAQNPEDYGQIQIVRSTINW